MTPTRIFFMALSALLGLLGLFVVSAARDAGLAMFGWGLFGFGVAFCFFLIKRNFDEADALRGH